MIPIDKGCGLRSSGDSLRSLDEDFAAGFQAEGHGVLEGNVETICVPSKEYDVDEVLDDLTECQGNDGQIVTAQT